MSGSEGNSSRRNGYVQPKATPKQSPKATPKQSTPKKK